jgi:hypothetical protein
MEWYVAANEFERRTDAHNGRLESLSTEWQRELVALERLHRDVLNGGYLQFLVNGGRESYVYASRALKTIGAHRMADIIDRCQALVDKHFPSVRKSRNNLESLLPNAVVDPQGNVIKKAGSVLPEVVCERISELSYEFMDFPDDSNTLAQRHYGPLIESDKPV